LVFKRKKRYNFGVLVTEITKLMGIYAAISIGIGAMIGAGIF
jgi:hypothetical protein